MEKTDVKVALIEWCDAESSDHWDDVEAFTHKPLPTILSSGFMVHETESYVLLALSLDLDNDKISNVLRIPKSAIREMSYLGEPNS